MKPYGEDDIPEPLARVEREEFARGHIGPDSPPVEPKPAATIVVARPAPIGLEILLLRRPESSSFAAGAYAFPGGVADAKDHDPSLAARLPAGFEAEPWALVAALRELYEETALVPAGVPPDHNTRLASRDMLLEGAVDFPTLAGELELDFADLRVVYFTRWITPRKLTRRYDTRFFLARAPEGQEPSLTEEHTGCTWSTPAAALVRFHEGRLPMLYPTLRTVITLADFGALDDAFASLEGRAVEPILAKLLIRGDSIRPVMPGDPGYEEGE